MHENVENGDLNNARWNSIMAQFKWDAEEETICNNAFLENQPKGTPGEVIYL